MNFINISKNTRYNQNQFKIKFQTDFDCITTM